MSALGGGSRRWEHELLYRYALAELRAKELGVTVASNRKEYVMRDASTSQSFARCSSIAEVERELTNLALAKRLKTAGPVVPEVGSDADLFVGQHCCGGFVKRGLRCWLCGAVAE